VVTIQRATDSIVTGSWPTDTSGCWQCSDWLLANQHVRLLTVQWQAAGQLTCQAADSVATGSWLTMTHQRVSIRLRGSDHVCWSSTDIAVGIVCQTYVQV